MFNRKLKDKINLLEFQIQTNKGIIEALQRQVEFANSRIDDTRRVIDTLMNHLGVHMEVTEPKDKQIIIVSNPSTAAPAKFKSKVTGR